MEKIKLLIRIRNRIIAGLAVVLPVALTLLVFKFVVGMLNSWVLSPLVRTLRPFLDGGTAVFVAKIGILFFVLILIYLIGWAANVIVLRKFFSLWEGIFLRIPLLGRVYKAFKQISAAVFGHGKTIFKGVVLVEYPRKGVFSLGFLTNQDEKNINDVCSADMVYVFMPTTPNPTTGVMIIVPKADVRQLDMSIEDGMKLVISGGAVIPQI